MPRVERAQPVVGHPRIGRLAGEASQRLRQRDPLLRPPATRRLALRILPADRGGDSRERIGRFDREVRPERQMRAGRSDRAPGVGAGQPLGPEPSFGHRPVAGLVSRLHRGDDPGLRQPPDVGRIENLGMFDPPAAVGAIGLAQFLIRTDDLRIGGIADGMHRDLEMIHRGAAGEVLQFGIVHQLKPARARRVAVRRLEPRPARAKRTIGVELDPGHAQAVAIEPRRRF